MKKWAYILLFIFGTFLIAPTTVVLIKSSVDISYAFTVNEEENNSDRIELKDKEIQFLFSLKPLVFLEDEVPDHFHSYKENYKHVFFDVLSPPPELV